MGCSFKNQFGSSFRASYVHDKNIQADGTGYFELCEISSAGLKHMVYSQWRQMPKSLRYEPTFATHKSHLPIPLAHRKCINKFFKVITVVLMSKGGEPWLKVLKKRVINCFMPSFEIRCWRWTYGFTHWNKHNVFNRLIVVLRYGWL